MFDIFYWIQLNGENLFEFVLEAAQSVAILILIYNEWVRRRNGKG